MIIQRQKIAYINNIELNNFTPDTVALIEVDAMYEAKTLYLPSPRDTHVPIRIAKIDNSSNTVTIFPPKSASFFLRGARSPYVLAAQGDIVEFYSNGTNGYF